jgi:hypothetical protein
VASFALDWLKTMPRWPLAKRVAWMEELLFGSSVGAGGVQWRPLSSEWLT